MKHISPWTTFLAQNSIWALALILAIASTACADEDEGRRKNASSGPKVELSGDNNIALSAQVNESATASFGFSNTGDAALTFELAFDSDWLTISPLEGSVEPDASQQATLTASCPDEPGEHSAEVELRTNDKGHEVLQLTVTLTCTAAPVVDPDLGSLAVTVSGLEGVAGSISIQGPESFSATVTETDTLTDLVPGEYRLVAADVTDGPATYIVTPDDLTVTVEADETAQAQFIYDVVRGTLEISITGLPDGLEGTGTIVAPDGTEQTFENGSVFDTLFPATYTLVAEVVTDLPAAYNAPQVEVTVTSGGVTPAEVVYQLVPAALNVTVTGLPDGLEGAVTVTGPEDFEANLTESTLLDDLAPGDYVVTPAAVDDGPARYTATTVNIEANSQETVEVEVVYELVLGRLDVTITGLPEGLDADVTVSNDDGFSQLLTATALLTDLVPGDYTITVADVTQAPAVYTAQGTAVTVSSAPTQTATVAYEAVFGSLDVAIAGLPVELDAAVLVSNDDGFEQLIISSETLVDLVPGDYTIAPGDILSGQVFYRATGSMATVTSNETAMATVTYVEFENPTEITTEDDSGPGSLRDTIADTLAGSTLTFADTVASIVLTGGEILIDKDLTIEGPGADALTISGNDASRIFSIAADVEVTISGVTFTQGSSTEGGAIRSEGTAHLSDCTFLANAATARGGAVFHTTGPLSITDCRFSNNTALRGAAIFSAAELDVMGSTFEANLASADGGAIYVDASAFVHTSTFTNNIASSGGAIFSQYRSGAGATSLVVERSLFANNQATQSLGGGAIRSGGVSSIANSTFTQNTTNGRGGAIYNFDNHDLYTYLTITGNEAANGGGVATFGDAATSITVGQSIIAANTATASGPDVFNASQTTPFSSRGYNIIGQDTGALGWADGENNDQVGDADIPLDPQLNALADNGGTSDTMSLTETSPARWAIPEVACLDADDLPLLEDQRGFARPQDEMCSIGAFEAQLAQ